MPGMARGSRIVVTLINAIGVVYTIIISVVLLVWSRTSADFGAHAIPIGVIACAVVVGAACAAAYRNKKWGWLILVAADGLWLCASVLLGILAARGWILAAPVAGWLLWMCVVALRARGNPTHL
jgi:hypothetical protein